MSLIYKALIEEYGIKYDQQEQKLVVGNLDAFIGMPYEIYKGLQFVLANEKEALLKELSLKEQNGITNKAANAGVCC